MLEMGGEALEQWIVDLPPLLLSSHLSAIAVGMTDNVNSREQAKTTSERVVRDAQGIITDNE